MKIYKILAIINVILITIKYITKNMCKNDIEAVLGKPGYIYGITNLISILTIPLDIIFFTINI